ncbi:hypothetical protein LDC_2893 [sediment metagenome]|uniref:Uncharacterized protein n=1 Tax=sediment metagenome TaxID=749907 RepID=D9PMW4_9ZZZZ
MIDKIEVIKKGEAKKSKLYFIREKVSKEIKRLTRRSKMVGLTTSSDIEETEKKIKEAEEAQKQAELEVAKANDVVVEEVVETENTENTENIENIEETKKD